MVAKAPAYKTLKEDVLARCEDSLKATEVSIRCFTNYLGKTADDLVEGLEKTDHIEKLISAHAKRRYLTALKITIEGTDEANMHHTLEEWLHWVYAEMGLFDVSYRSPMHSAFLQHQRLGIIKAIAFAQVHKDRFAKK